MNLWCNNEQAACGSVILMVVLAVQEVYLAHNFSHFLHHTHQIQSFKGWNFD